MRIYYGNQAQLTSKYVSRQKLCLSATTEYWVNDSSGMPYLVVSGELNEKLREVIETKIISAILQTDFIEKRKQDNEYKIQVIGNNVDMLLYEQETILNQLPFREVRSLNGIDHQTSIITTHPAISIEQIAGQMFSRWSQENFFRYMIADYDFDKMVQFGIETIDENRLVINPEYRKITHRIKKIKEKIARKGSKFPSDATRTISCTH